MSTAPEPSRPGIMRASWEVLEGAPVLLVAHDCDGRWRVSHTHHEAVAADDVTGDVDVNGDPGGAPVYGAAVSWAEFVAADPTLEHTASLLPGWSARRDRPTSPWRRAPQ